MTNSERTADKSSLEPDKIRLERGWSRVKLKTLTNTSFLPWGSSRGVLKLLRKVANNVSWKIVTKKVFHNFCRKV